VLTHAHDGLVEAALARLVYAFLADVPFTKHAGRVAGGLELLGDDVAVQREFGDVRPMMKTIFGLAAARSDAARAVIAVDKSRKK